MDTNSTVTLMQCDGQWSEWQCIQGLTMTVLFSLAGVMGVSQIVQLMASNRPRSVNRPLMVLFFAVLICILGLVHFAFVPTIALYFIILFVKLLLLCVLTYLLHSSFLQMFHRDYLRAWVAWPWLMFCIFSAAVITVVGITQVPRRSVNDCYDISFGLMDAASVTISLASLFSVTCFSRRLNQQLTSSSHSSYPSSIAIYQVRLLRALVIVFCLTSMIGSIGDAVMRIKNIAYKFECDGILVNNQKPISSLIITLRVIELVLPVMAVNYAFTVKVPQRNPNNPTPDDYEATDNDSVRLAMTASYAEY